MVFLADYVPVPFTFNFYCTIGYGEKNLGQFIKMMYNIVTGNKKTYREKFKEYL